MNFSQLRKPTLALFLVILGAGTALTQTRGAKTATVPDDQVAFTATGSPNSLSARSISIMPQPRVQTKEWTVPRGSSGTIPAVPAMSPASLIVVAHEPPLGTSPPRDSIPPVAVHRNAWPDPPTATPRLLIAAVRAPGPSGRVTSSSIAHAVAKNPAPARRLSS